MMITLVTTGFWKSAKIYEVMSPSYSHEKVADADYYLQHQQTRQVDLQKERDEKGRVDLRKRQDSLRLPTWVIVWFYVTAVICTWDASFIVFRPFSLPGGSLAWIWYLYKFYIALDQRYQDIGDAYVFAQSLMNYVEVILNLITIAMHYKNSRHTVTTAFMVSVMTFWKTILYMLMLSEFCTGGEYRKGNSPVQEFFIVFIPNFVWVVVPFQVMFVLWGQLTQSHSNSNHIQQRDLPNPSLQPSINDFIEGAEVPSKHSTGARCLSDSHKTGNGFVRDNSVFTDTTAQLETRRRKNMR